MRAVEIETDEKRAFRIGAELAQHNHGLASQKNRPRKFDRGRVDGGDQLDVIVAFGGQGDTALAAMCQVVLGRDIALNAEGSGVLVYIDVPFAGAAQSVALGFEAAVEDIGRGSELGLHRVQFDIGQHLVGMRVEAGEHGSAGRRAQAAGRKGPVEGHPLGGEAVEGGGRTWVLP